MILIFIAGGAFLLYLLQLGIYRKFWDKELRVSLRFTSESVYEKETAVLEEVVENHKRLPPSGTESQVPLFPVFTV